MLAILPPALVARLWKKDVWLVTERPTQARDNGYCFFKYLRKQQPQQKVYYIIDKTAPDYQKIKDLGDVLSFDSWKHYFYYCVSKVHISAHTGGCCPSSAPICKYIKKALGIIDVFIPHGVSYGVSEFCLQKYTKINLFICSGEPEYENVLQNYGYSENEVAYTGFPRLDGWHHISVDPKQIVFMPTWRAYLAQNPDTVFAETSYFKAYDEVLRNPALAEFLEQNDLRLIFYLHNDMRKYVGAFHTDCKRIEIVDRDEQYDIQELLKSSALLITDYSSVHFDFAYMEKPVLYFQFDKEEFFDRQYQKSFFDAERDGFGPVAYDSESLVERLKEAYERGFALSEPYYGRMRKFYVLHDEKNSERVYREIRKKTEKRN